MYEGLNLVREHAVYRVFDAADQLLYVGCTVTPFTRTKKHMHKPWAREIAKITIQWLPTWATARQAEAQAIHDEHPKFNRTAPDPDGTITRKGRKPRGTPGRCPHCNGLKPEKAAYCVPCQKQYNQEYHIRRKAALLTLKTV